MTRDELVTSVEAALERDPDINLHGFPIRISHNDALSLEGTVEDIVALRKTVQIARQVSGNGRVEDHLHIQTGVERTGDQLRQAVVEALSGERAFRDVSIGDARTGAPGAADDQDWIVVSATGSRVNLDGSLSSLARRRLAEVIAWWVPGSSRVEDRIHVVPPEEDSDTEISDAVHMVLEKDPSLDAGQIQILTRDRKVTLAGSVRSEANRRIAIRDCWYIPGVHGVDNQLQVIE